MSTEGKTAKEPNSNQTRQIGLILACDEKGGIGKNGSIPWRCPGDLAFFKKMTTGTNIIMGRKTYESLKNQDLPSRNNIVIGQGYYPSLEVAIKTVSKHPIWVIGGANLAESALAKGLIDYIYLTIVEGDYQCDTFIPNRLSGLFSRINHCFRNKPINDDRPSDKWNAKIHFIENKMAVYHCLPCNQEEFNFHQLIRKIRDTGSLQNDRTGVGTKSLFGHQLRFSLRDKRFPLQTSRKTSFRMIFEELMWFLRGQTNAKILEEKGISIWTKNSTRKFLDQNKLTYLQEGDCGPIYGFQWRHWGATYENCRTDYTGKGVDQIKGILQMIKECPASRRMILSGWNVSDLSEMVLPPCHTMYQFNVIPIEGKKEGKEPWGLFNCHLYQRSSDVLLAGHWNVSSAALLTILIASISNLEPGELIVSYGDVHLYKNHLDQVDEYLSRIPYEYPTLTVLESPKVIEDFQFTNLKLDNYQYYPPIILEMNP